MSSAPSTTWQTFARRWLWRWEALVVAILAILPLVMGQNRFVTELPGLFILAIVALALNVVVGYTGLLHLAIAAFFGIGAYLTGIVRVPIFPFQVGFGTSLVIATLGAAAAGLMLGAPTLRLRGDYLAVVTLGFGEVVRFSLRNLEEITAGMQGLNPVPPPTNSNLWTDSYRAYYYLMFGILAVVVWLLMNLERSRLGRAWMALREDELAATCMGINATRVKLSAFAVAAGLAGLAGCLYATKATSTTDPESYNFNRSIILLCCLILGGMGSIRGTLVGVLLVLGFDYILAPWIDELIQTRGWNPEGHDLLKFSSWRLILFGLVLILMMRFRPEGLLPAARVKDELHPAARPAQ